MERLSFAFARAINISATAHDERRSTMTKVLFILTGSGEWALKDGSMHEGGFWSPEFVYPHHAFEEAGWDINAATLGGVPAPVGEASLALTVQENDQSSVDFQRVYLERPEIKSLLANPARLEDLDPDDYDVVFVPGGFGVFEDIGDNPVVGRFVAAMYARDKVVATICSGASALLGARNDDGSWPFVGKRITGFPISEKIDFGVAEGAPWLLESRLTEAGAAYTQVEKHKVHLELDGNLVTGQNGASARETAAAVIETVREKTRAVEPASAR
jgi:putative intracellular protease/amidase